MAVVHAITRLQDDVLDRILYHLIGNTSYSGTLELSPNIRSIATPLYKRYNRDVASFRLVSRKLNTAYKRFFVQSTQRFESLPREVLELVLDLLIGSTNTSIKLHHGELKGQDRSSSSTITARPQYQDLSLSDLAKILPPTNLKDVLNFRLVNKRCAHTFAQRFGRRPSILDLPSEIHDIILQYLVNYNTDGQLIPIAKKSSLSVESFTLLVPQQNDTKSIANYRLVCRQFAQRAIRCQFTRVWVRFSDDGFERLRFVAERPHLAQTVKQFSYMIPRFYFQENAIFEELSRRTKAMMAGLKSEMYDREKSTQTTQRPTFSQLQSRLARTEENKTIIFKTMEKAKEQHSIVSQKRDFQGLSSALNAFVNLEQIRFMKVMDQVDSDWMNLIEMYPEFRERLNAEWHLACEHSAKTLTEALILSNARNFQRLSSRFMDPSTPISLSEGSSGAISQVAKRLKSLELEFDNRWNLDEKVKELSGLFRLVFAEAKALENLHIGFRRLVSVPIFTIFHDIRWERLSYLGLHQWELESQELVDLLLRYRHIKYLRLRYVCLKKGSWARVLKTIRLNLNLNWISLRGISYHGASPHILGLQPALGHGPEESDDDSDSVSWTGSESNDSEDEDSSDDGESEHQNFDSASDDDDDHDSGDSDDDDDDAGDDSDDHESILGHGVHIGSLPSTIETSIPESPTTTNPGMSAYTTNNYNNNNNNSTLFRLVRQPSQPGQCYCFNGYAWDKLDDNRETVQESQWKKWQKWVLKPCRLHDSEAASLEGDSESEDDDSDGNSI